MIDIYKILPEVKIRYEKGENLIRFINNYLGHKRNSQNAILVSYDFQAGTYTKAFDSSNNEPKTKYVEELVGYLSELEGFDSYLHVGTGECITQANILARLSTLPSKVFGLDISWSRIKYAKEFTKRFNIPTPTLFTANLLNLPFPDNSIDLVMSNHSLEPNGGKEKEAITELFRVSRKYVVLNEPCYEFASDEGKKRIDKLGYVKNLHKVANELGIKIYRHKPFINPVNKANPTTHLVLVKNAEKHTLNPPQLSCPITKKPLSATGNTLFSEDSLQSYPIVDEIPCLLPENAILTSHRKH